MPMRDQRGDAMSRLFKIRELKESECLVWRSPYFAARIAPAETVEPAAPAYVPKAAGLFGAR
jgi:hypothetical protein